MNRMEEVKKEFLRKVAKHEMTVLKEDGVYRHLRFGIPGNSIYRFDILTWPYHLVITGDCGTAQFSRVEDMFEFFIMEKQDWNYQNVINPIYWEEKLLASSFDTKQFSCDLVEEFIRERFESFASDKDLDENERDNLWEALSNRLLCVDFNTESEAIESLIDFKDPYTGFSFDDAWDNNFKEYSPYYLWNCHAIVWGIQRYNERSKHDM